ncbi:MAG TPA: SUMF1/EgtB/PvdO family nonheme iron enzyme [Phycisphaerales bacterium]|nr:SUMF1/EgtB/PvdO family nonheme iron enzyme [Phycisphaerales bacterium]
MTSTLIILAAYLSTVAAPLADQPTAAPPAPADAKAPATEEKAPATLTQAIPAAAYEVEFTQVPQRTVDGKARPAFYLSTTEITWDAFDTFVFALDGTDKDSKPASGKPADAVSRPSKPYIPPDRGFGHEGYAAICVSAKSAQEFCKWLTMVAGPESGRTFRLPTEDEWEHAARGGATTAFPWGDDAAQAEAHAWTNANSENTTHPVGTKPANALGFKDMIGNAREWVVGRDGQLVVKGGSYRDAPEACTIAARWAPEKAWQATDPQIPKSQWWLSDGSFIGFRVVCEVAPKVTSTSPSDELTK